MGAKTKRLNWWGTILLGLAAFGLSLTLVWLNVQMVNMAYDMKQLRSRLQSEKTLNAKLEVERMHLVSDYRLQELATRLELSPPVEDQVRRIR